MAIAMVTFAHRIAGTIGYNFFFFSGLCLNVSLARPGRVSRSSHRTPQFKCALGFALTPINLYTLSVQRPYYSSGREIILITSQHSHNL
jgi:hypothetical protein